MSTKENQNKCKKEEIDLTYKLVNELMNDFIKL